MSVDTPMVRQYKKIKHQYPDAILFFRLGDFYEMFYEDAKTASQILGITLTSRSKSEKNPIPLCGVPFHSVEPYLAKLLENGLKVAICEQVEDPKLAKGIVERKVVKVLTPGVILDPEQLDLKSNNYIASVSQSNNKFGLSYSDISTGEFRTCLLESISDLKNELSNINPKEILISEDFIDKNEFISYINSTFNSTVSERDSYLWDINNARLTLMDYLGVKSLEAFNLENEEAPIKSSGALVQYLLDTQMDDMPPIKPPLFYETKNFLQIDESTKSNLEIINTVRGDTKFATLLSIIDLTVTAMGGRLLKNWLNYPLVDINKILKRLDRVEELKNDPLLRNNLRASLKDISDIERLISRISTTSCKPRDLGSLRDSIVFIKDIKDKLLEKSSELFKQLEKELDNLDDVYQIIYQSIVEEPPNSIRTPPIIGPGYHEELDNLRLITKDGKKWISELEVKEKEKTGINFLKIGYNKVFGYYIEVTKPNISLVPDSYIRKQTLVNAERFVTPELKEQEEKIIGAEDRILELEKQIFDEIRVRVESQSIRIRKTASVLAELDVLAALSEVSERYNYSKPDINEGSSINLSDSRHPIIERMELMERFVPNDITLNRDENQLLIITGPNMAGKSTLIRQTALCVLLAQIGSFVPAKSASIGIVDKIFTRVGASDNLAKGQSTFMVEMVETAYILRNATEKSLVILDEIGRGTSTFDGMSIAWAVAEYLHNLGCKTMFATHYHELAQLAAINPGIKNYNFYVKEIEDKIVFLRKLIPGATSHSYGIQVAKLAGIPDEVLIQAKKVLYNLEMTQSDINSTLNFDQLELFEDKNEKASQNGILKVLTNIDIMNITPLEALNKLAELKNKLDS